MLLLRRSRPATAVATMFDFRYGMSGIDLGTQIDQVGDEGTPKSKLSSSELREAGSHRDSDFPEITSVECHFGMHSYGAEKSCKGGFAQSIVFCRRIIFN